MGMWLIAAACTAAAVLVIIVFNSWRRLVLLHQALLYPLPTGYVYSTQPPYMLPFPFCQNDTPCSLTLTSTTDGPVSTCMASRRTARPSSTNKPAPNRPTAQLQTARTTERPCKCSITRMPCTCSFSAVSLLPQVQPV
jgi:hypothetical protein